MARSSRSTADLLLLLVAGTICAVVVVAVVAVAVVEVTRPEQDTSHVRSIIGGILSTLLGALSGYIAGRTRTRGDRDA